MLGNRPRCSRRRWLNLQDVEEPALGAGGKRPKATESASHSKTSVNQSLLELHKLSTAKTMLTCVTSLIFKAGKSRYVHANEKLGDLVTSLRGTEVPPPAVTAFPS